MRALVLGAGGQVGRAVALELAQAGWAVDAASTHAPGLPDLAGGGIRAVSGSRADLVGAQRYDAVIDPLAFDARDAEVWRALAPRIGALAVISTASVYADAGGHGLESPEFPLFPDPIAESQPCVAPGPSATAGYSAGKVAMEQAFADFALPVALLRPGAIHGIGGRHPREFWFVKRALDGRRRVALRHPDNVFHTTSTQGLARLTRLCLEAGFRGPINAGDGDAPTIRQIAANVAAVMGHAFDLYDPGPDAPDSVGASPWSAPGPMRLDLGLARSLGFDPPAHADHLAPYIAWMVGRAANWRQEFPVFTRYGHDPFDDGPEDAALP